MSDPEAAATGADRAQPTVGMLRDPGHFLALGFGSGLARMAPGTWGSLAGLVVYLPLSGLGPTWYWGAALLMFALGVPLCERTARALGVHDHGAIVWDEIVGVVLTLGAVSGGVAACIVGWIGFRAFDILKPWPIRTLDARVGGGFGIMLDDAVAALFAVILVKLFEYFSESYKLFL